MRGRASPSPGFRHQHVLCLYKWRFHVLTCRGLAMNLKIYTSACMLLTLPYSKSDRLLCSQNRDFVIRIGMVALSLLRAMVVPNLLHKHG